MFVLVSPFGAEVRFVFEGDNNVSSESKARGLLRAPLKDWGAPAVTHYNREEDQKKTHWG
jgi:hypothetical protein